MSDPSLAEFLLARIAEDKEAARKATPGRWKLWAMSVLADQDGTSNVDTAVLVADTYGGVNGHPRTFNASHIARWDPARVLADCEAKLRILGDEELWLRGDTDRVARLLASAYADHPDYRAEWRP